MPIFGYEIASFFVSRLILFTLGLFIFMRQFNSFLMKSLYLFFKKDVMRMAFLSLCFFLSISHFSAQEYIEMMLFTDKYTVAEIQSAAENYFEGKDKGRGSGYKQFKRWEYNALRMMDESGKVKPQEFYLKELEKYNAERNKSVQSRSSTDDYWEEMGPTYWNATTSWNPGVGRITGFTGRSRRP